LSKTADHLKEAAENEKLAKVLEVRPEYCGWRCTLLFYASLHYIQAYFSSFDVPLVFEEHKQRDDAIANDSGLVRIRRDYRRLKDLSENARYEFYKPTVADFANDIVPSLIAIKRHLKDFFPTIEV
jgi:hypothetical protein